MKFRTYTNKNKTIQDTYVLMFQYQSKKYASNMKRMYLEPPFVNRSIMSMMNRLDDIKDESDPDTTSSQLIHSYQTAESLSHTIIYPQNHQPLKSLFSPSEWNSIPLEYRSKYPEKIFNLVYDKEWLPLVGFIHDLGKILVLPELGQLPQWSVVGDTFPIGAPLDNNFPFSHLCNNIDLSNNIYNDSCGFDSMLFSWGHDEYMAQVLERNYTKLPPEAVYLIRYHSFYSWHSPRNGSRGYTRYASEHDWNMLPLLKLFSQSDLYSKKDFKISIPECEKKYKKLITDYFRNPILQW